MAATTSWRWRCTSTCCRCMFTRAIVAEMEAPVLILLAAPIDSKIINRQDCLCLVEVWDFLHAERAPHI